MTVSAVLSVIKALFHPPPRIPNLSFSLKKKIRCHNIGPDNRSVLHTFHREITHSAIIKRRTIETKNRNFCSFLVFRLSMHTKYVCRGLINLYVNFHNNRTMWSTNLHVKLCRWGGGGGKSRKVILNRLSYNEFQKKSKVELEKSLVLLLTFLPAANNLSKVSLVIIGVLCMKGFTLSCASSIS